MPTSESDFALAMMRVPHLDEYFGLWAIQPEPFLAAVDRCRSINLPTHLELHARDGEVRGAYRGDDYEVRGDVAVIELRGPLMKYTSSLSGGTSTVRVRRQLSNAAENDEIRGILLRVDSPGGTVSGTEDLAGEVRRAAARKPVYALIEDLGASAAYWVASQAQKVFAANQTTLIGSIGTYGVIADYSAAAAMAGIKVHILKSGPFKGAGATGVEISPEQLAEFQRIVNEINQHFLAGVAAGRRLSPEAVAALADGRVHLAEPAAGLRLVDGIQTFDEALSLFRGKAPRSPKAMSETPESAAPRAATYQEIRAALPKADPAFVCQQLEASATLDQCRSAYTAKLEADLAAASELAQTKTREAEEAAKAKASEPPKRPGAEPLRERSTEPASEGDPLSEWNAHIDEEVARGVSRPRAASIVNRKFPGLQQAVVAAANP